MLHCDCGFEARAADEEGLVAVVQRHARDVHGMTLSDDEARLLASRVDLGSTPPFTTPRENTAPTEEEET